MNKLMNTPSFILWQEVIQDAEKQCAITLKAELEAYLVTLLIRYTDKPEVVKQVLAKAYLEALQKKKSERHLLLQQVGDQCLLFSGLFPRLAEKKNLKINYFVDMGQSAYATVSQTASDLYASLAMQFVLLMDILQSIRPNQDLLPFEAYEQWQQVGSHRALTILQSYTKGTPLRIFKS